MGITLAHNFVSAKGNGTDLTLIQPSNWNDQHVLKLDANNLLGKLTAGNGPAEQIPLSAFMATLLAAADAPTLAGLLGISTTGDGKITLKTTPDTGWLMMDDGTFGNAGSGASNRANVDCLALFTLIYNNISDTGAPVLTSGGGASTRAAQGTAASAWAALCRLSLPKQLGRAIVGAGAGAGLTNRPLGTTFGADAITLALNQIPSGITSANPTQPIVVTGPNGHTVPSDATLSNNGVAPGTGSSNVWGGGAATNSLQFSGANNINVTSNNTGGATTPVMQASEAWNVMVKL